MAPSIAREAAIWAPMAKWGRLVRHFRDRAQRFEASLDRFDLLREAEAHLAAAQCGVVEEARSRHCGDGGLLDEVPRERDVVIEAECFDPRHHVVRPVRGLDLETALPQSRDDRVTTLLVVTKQLHIEGRGQLERACYRDLQRVRRADRQEVVDLADA